MRNRLNGIDMHGTVNLLYTFLITITEGMMPLLRLFISACIVSHTDIEPLTIQRQNKINLMSHFFMGCNKSLMLLIS